MECKSENIGNAIPDIAGVGIILAFAILAGLSLVFAGIGYCATLQARWKHSDASGDFILENNREMKRMQFSRLRRLELTEKVLGSISEVQLFNGIALLTAAMVQRNSLSLYHLHVVYDTVNFTAVSFTASIFVFWLSRKIQKQNVDNGHRNNT
ncbi:hypothetical protein BKA58DRAFT_130184 [Alternaria rosae]|uniref:uncharacterized protein n=1 Tax=Alternaria rosae TaxID=1187941 RepID=UPI001E8E1D57|nr:uncharacterized protein BKA58DRAFT_130184 [Alternaria rosae]KAH6875866.1 hypothetical protein BKA58DRAFT_130184 [Alternaria rosae]